MSEIGNQTPPLNGAALPWYSGFDDELKGAISNNGWDKLEQTAATEQAMKSWRELQKKMGIPADRILRIPDPADDAGWKTVHQKLGVPDTPDGYDFSTVKRGDGSALDDDTVAFLRSTAASLAIPKDRAPQLAAAVVKRVDERDAAATAAAAIQNGEARLRLQQNWSVNMPANKFVADRTAAMLGLPPELIAEIEKSPKYDVIMEGLRQAGERMGEAQLVGVGGPGGAGQRVTTREGAVARIEELKKDKAWYARWKAGDADALREWDHLNNQLVPRAG